MRKLIDELDHLCSVKEFSNIGGTLILRDEQRAFNYCVEVLREKNNEFIIKLPLAKLDAINPKELLSELKWEFKRKCELSKVEECNNFDEVIKFFSRDVSGTTRGDIKYLFLGMPHHPEKEFHDCAEQLCTLRYNSFELSLDFDQIDVALYADAPINIFYCSLFAVLISSTSGLIISNLSFNFHNCYILKENLPKIAKVIELDDEICTVRVRINKPINDFTCIDCDSFEIEIL